MHVRECMSMNPKACVPEQSCAIAGVLMRRHRYGFVPIVASLKTKRVVGVVTDRDIVLQLVRSNLPANRVALQACMTQAPVTIAPEASLEEAMRVMTQAAVHRLPVIEDGKLVGVLSLQDIALAVRRQWAYIGPHVTERHVTEVLEAIAVARERRPAGSRR